jgi:hypothetical protein
MALTFCLSLAVVGCGGSSSPAVPASGANTEGKPSPGVKKPQSKAEIKKQFLEEESTAAEKRAARLKAGKEKN